MLIFIFKFAAQQILEPKNAEVKKEVILRPAPVSGPITAVTWKHNNDIALEWFGRSDVTSYREFKGMLI